MAKEIENISIVASSNSSPTKVTNFTVQQANQLIAGHRNLARIYAKIGMHDVATAHLNTVKSIQQIIKNGTGRIV